MLPSMFGICAAGLLITMVLALARASLGPTVLPQPSEKDAEKAPLIEIVGALQARDAAG